MRRFEHVLRNWTSSQWRGKTETIVMVGGRYKGLTGPCGWGKFLPRWAGRKKVWVMIQRKLKEFGRKLVGVLIRCSQFSQGSRWEGHL